MQKRKVVLYNPKAVFFDMPLALLAIGSALDADRFEVQIIDARVDADADALLVAACQDAVCLGVTALSGAPLRDAVRATHVAKAANPELPVVWGGWHPSLFPEEILREEASIDVCVYGQGEDTFRELVEAFCADTSLRSVKGIAYRAETGIKKTAPRVLQDQDQLPSVNYDLIDVEKYFEAKGQRQFDYISSTGCFFRCAFCADPFVFKRRWTAVSAARMGEELAHWHRKYGFTDVNFQDETFFTYRDRCIDIANALIDRRLDISWAATMRADQGCRMSMDDFRLLRKSGLRRALIGVESGSQEMMDWLKKDIKLEQVFECARRCKELEIACIFPFIVGFPGETDDSVRASLDVIKRLRAMSDQFQTPIFYFKPYPGSSITTAAVEQGYQLPTSLQDWSDFDYVGSVGGPWVDDPKYRLIERFKFYSGLAWSRPSILRAPLQALARARCKVDYYGFAIEKAVIQRLVRQSTLS